MWRKKMELNKNSNLIIRLVNLKTQGILGLKEMQDEVNSVIKDSGLCIYKIKINIVGDYWALYTVVLAEKNETTVNVANANPNPLDSIDLNNITYP